MLLSDVAELVHVLDCGFVDEGSGFAADLERVAVVPFDAAFHLFSVFEDEDHWGLGLDLLLQVEEFRMAERALGLGSREAKWKEQARETCAGRGVAGREIRRRFLGRFRAESVKGSWNTILSQDLKVRF